MISKWFELKDIAVKSRKKGLSINHIERNLGIPRSTLSNWFNGIELSQEQKNRLNSNRKNALVQARKKAAIWHKEQKKERLREAENQALKTIENINVNDKKLLELMLAILYMGEGTKRKIETAMGSSNPLILKFFLTTLKILYKIDPKKIRCQLSLRADQNPDKIKHFWAKELNLSLANFRHVNLDKRTIGSKTYPQYKGVCYLSCGNVAIQRKLTYLSEIFCTKIIKNYSGT